MPSSSHMFLLCLVGVVQANDNVVKTDTFPSVRRRNQASLSTDLYGSSTQDRHIDKNGNCHGTGCNNQKNSIKSSDSTKRIDIDVEIGSKQHMLWVTANVNQHKVKLILDTGSTGMLITDETSRHVGSCDRRRLQTFPGQLRSYYNQSSMDSHRSLSRRFPGQLSYYYGDSPDQCNPNSCNNCVCYQDGSGFENIDIEHKSMVVGGGKATVIYGVAKTVYLGAGSCLAASHVGQGFWGLGGRGGSTICAFSNSDARLDFMEANSIPNIFSLQIPTRSAFSQGGILRFGASPSQVLKYAPLMISQGNCRGGNGGHFYGSLTKITTQGNNQKATAHFAAQDMFFDTGFSLSVFKSQRTMRALTSALTQAGVCQGKWQTRDVATYKQYYCTPSTTYSTATIQFYFGQAVTGQIPVENILVSDNGKLYLQALQGGDLNVLGAPFFYGNFIEFDVVNSRFGFGTITTEDQKTTEPVLVVDGRRLRGSF